MKIVLALSSTTQYDIKLLTDLCQLPLISSTGARRGMKHEFDARGKGLAELAEVANVVTKAFGKRCVAAHPSGNRFVVTLTTELRKVDNG